MTTLTEKTSRSLTDAEIPAVRKIDRPDVWNLFFREVHKMPEGWEWVSVNSDSRIAPQGFARIEGGFRSYGKNGKKKWAGRDKSGDATFFIEMAILRAFEAKCAINLGVCPKCWGEGRIQTTISTEPSRNRFAKCVECGGSGNPPITEATAL